MSELFAQIDALQQKINALKPLSPEQLNNMKEYYRVGLTYSSNALEGNSLTETETKIALEDGLTVGGKPLVDYLEAVGHGQAYDLLYTLVGQAGFTERDIKELHRLFYYRLDQTQAGVYRKVKVVISGSQYALPAPDQLELLMHDFINDYGKNPGKHPVKWAALVHERFVFIHPFIDGNGRVARLLLNLALMQSGYVVTAIPLILRRDYIAALERAHVDDTDFIQLIARCVKETQQDYLRLFA